MKKLFAIATLVAAILLMSGADLFAQRTVIMPRIAGDTLVNTDTVSKVLPRLTDGYSGVVVTVKVEKLSGTVDGLVGVYASADGATWDLVDSVSVTNVATQQKTFRIAAPLPEYLRVTQYSTGTMSAVPTVSYRITRYALSR